MTIEFKHKQLVEKPIEAKTKEEYDRYLLLLSQIQKLLPKKNIKKKETFVFQDIPSLTFNNKKRGT